MANELSFANETRLPVTTMPIAVPPIRPTIGSAIIGIARTVIGSVSVVAGTVSVSIAGTVIAVAGTVIAVSAGRTRSDRAGG